MECFYVKQNQGILGVKMKLELSFGYERVGNDKREYLETAWSFGK